MRIFRFLIKTAGEVMLNLFIGILTILAIGGIIGVIFNVIRELA